MDHPFSGGNDQQQKRFSSDAGHELKTPVAVIRTDAKLPDY